MTTVQRTEPRVPPRDQILTKHVHGNYLLRRRADEWATQATRTAAIEHMEAFVALRTWAREWTIKEVFHDNSISRAVPRGPASLVQPEALDEVFRRSKGIPLLQFRVVRDRDATELEISIQFPAANKTPIAPLLIQVTQGLDAVNRQTP